MVHDMAKIGAVKCAQYTNDPISSTGKNIHIAFHFRVRAF